MYFSSLLFLFVFLPIVLAVYYIVPRKFRNAFLLLANLVFYGWGEPVFILIMIVSVVSNYIFGLLIEKYRDNQKRKKTFLVLSLVISLGLLAVFKYTGFVTDILRAIPPFIRLMFTEGTLKHKKALCLSERMFHFSHS